MMEKMIESVEVINDGPADWGLLCLLGLVVVLVLGFAGRGGKGGGS